MLDLPVEVRPARPYSIERLAAVLLALVIAAAYSVDPIRLKGRGLWQLPFYWLSLFTGPMLFSALLFSDRPSWGVVAVALAYGMLQTGVIMINTAAFAISSDVPNLTSGTVLAIILRRCSPVSAEAKQVAGETERFFRYVETGPPRPPCRRPGGVPHPAPGR